MTAKPARKIDVATLQTNDAGRNPATEKASPATASRRHGSKKNGALATTECTELNGADKPNSSTKSRAKIDDSLVPDALTEDAGQPNPEDQAQDLRPLYVPTDTEIKSELWRIATGEGSEASRVSALRVLADIMGLLRTAPPELPEAMSAYMDALARGLSRPSST